MTAEKPTISLYEDARRADYFRYLLAASAPQPQGWLACVLLNAEWEKIVNTTTEPMVAAIKLAWWREALEEIAAGNSPRKHPLLLALPANADIPKLHQLLETHADNAERNSFETKDIWLEYHAQMSGILLQLADAKVPTALGTAWGVIETLWRLPNALMQGWLPLPEDVLTAHGIELHAFLHAPDEQKLVPVVESLAREQLSILEKMHANSRLEKAAITILKHNAAAILKRRGRVLVHPLRPSYALLPLKLALS